MSNISEEEFRATRLSSVLALALAGLTLTCMWLGHEALDQRDPDAAYAMAMFITAAVLGLGVPLLLLFDLPRAPQRAWFLLGAVPVAVLGYFSASQYATLNHCDGTQSNAEMWLPVGLMATIALLVLAIIALVKLSSDFEQAGTLALGAALIVGTGFALTSVALAVTMDNQVDLATQEWQDWDAIERSRWCSPNWGMLAPLGLLLVGATLLRRKVTI